MPLVNITIIGAGAIGTFIAAKIAPYAYLTIISKNQYLEKGIVLTTSEGIQVVKPEEFNLSISPTLPNLQSQNIVIITVKEYSLTPELARIAVDICTADGLIIIIQNGIPPIFFNEIKIPGLTETSRHTLLNILNERQTISIFPVIACHTNIIENSLMTYVTRPLNQITVAFPENYKHPQLNNLLLILNSARVNCNYSSKTLPELVLEKLQFYLSINVLSMLFNKSLGEIFYADAFKSIIKFIVNFVILVGDKLGISLRSYEQFMKIQITATHYSSMHADFKNGKTLEINSIKTLANLANQLDISISACEKIEKIYEILSELQVTRNIDLAQQKIKELFLPLSPNQLSYINKL